jgi:ribose transport system ATP-binding protein
MHEPTQGVDVGARQRIFQRIATAAEEGQAFVLASAEHEDLAHLCDRVLVFRHGRVVGELTGNRLSPDALLNRCLQDESQQVGSGTTQSAAASARRNTHPGGER